MGMEENCYYAYLIFNNKDVENIKNTMCCLKCGYPKPTEKDKILYGKVKSIRVINGKNTDLAIDKDVYDPWYTRRFDECFDEIYNCCKAMYEYILKDYDN